MKYFKCIEEGYDYFTKEATIPNALYLPSQRNRMFPHLPDNFFEKVEVKKTETYTSFGCRYLCEDAKVNSWIYTKEQAEHIIYEHMREIKHIAEQHYPSDIYTSLCFIDGNTIFNNTYYNPFIEMPIDYHSLVISSPSSVDIEILTVLERIKNVLKDYCPESYFLNMCVTSDGDIFFFNDYWKKNVIHKLSFFSKDKEV